MHTHAVAKYKLLKKINFIIITLDRNLLPKFFFREVTNRFHWQAVFFLINGFSFRPEVRISGLNHLSWCMYTNVFH